MRTTDKTTDVAGRRAQCSVCPSPAWVLSLTLSVLLCACATGGVPATLTAAASTAPPPQWYAHLPHNGSLTQLSQWWQQQHDPLLVAFIEAAQAVSPSVATARANIEQSRASRTASQAALLPTLDATGSLNRSLSAPINRANAAPGNFAQLGLQTSWELDLFGQNAASRDADQARFEGAQAHWHDARVSVAAEVATQYYNLRTCQKLHQVAEADASSRAETARLTALASSAGFDAPANAALARASAAEGRAKATQQRAQCDVDTKALVAMTAFTEPVLRQKLAAVSVAAASESFIGISSVPADVLAQRPDVFNAEREVTAASFEVRSARAQRYPRLSLAGSITTSKSRVRSVTQGFDTWSIGPLALTVPLFDGGASQAQLEAAKARYEEAAGKYRSTIRQAVRDVEEALVKLQSTGERLGDAAQATAGYQAFFAATQARYKAGLASLVGLEDARRTVLAAQSALLGLELERRTAWVALYRALGGGWTAATPHPLPHPPSMAFAPPESARQDDATDPQKVTP